MRRPSPLTTTCLAAALVLLPSAAGAQTADDGVLQQHAEATTGLVTVDLLPELVGDTLLQLEETAASASELSGETTSHGAVDVLRLLGETAPLGDRSAASEGPPVADPGDAADECMAPDPGVPGVAVELVCTSATAEADDLAARGELLVGGVDLGGEVVADLLAGALVDELDPLLEQLGLDLLDDLTVELTAACDALVDGLLDPTLETVQDLFDLVDLGGPLAPDVQDVVDDPVCAALAALTGDEDPGAGLLDTTAVAAAIAELDLLTLTIDEVSSETVLAGDTLAAVATQPVVQVTGPSLDPLDAIVTALLDTAVTDLLDTLDTLGGGQLAVLLDELPTVGELVDQLEAALPIFDDSAPLVTVTVGAATARAEVDQTTGAVTTVVEQTLAEVSLAPSIVELLGGDPAGATVSVPEGGSQTVGQGTPLASTVTLASSSTAAATSETAVGVLDGERASAAAVRLDLLQGVLGGIDVQLGGVTAAAFADLEAAPTPTAPAPDPAPEPDPDPAPDPVTPSLPETGGGAAALGLLAVLAAGALRRRS